MTDFLGIDLGNNLLGVAGIRRTIVGIDERSAIHVPPGEGKKLWVAED